MVVTTEWTYPRRRANECKFWFENLGVDVGREEREEIWIGWDFINLGVPKLVANVFYWVIMYPTLTTDCRWWNAPCPLVLTQTYFDYFIIELGVLKLWTLCVLLLDWGFCIWGEWNLWGAWKVFGSLSMREWTAFFDELNASNGYGVENFISRHWKENRILRMCTVN